MRAFLMVLAVLVVLVVGGVLALGYSREWFHVTVNEDKMQEDTDAAKKTVQGLGKKAAEGTGTKSSGIQSATGSVKKVEADEDRFVMTTTDETQLTVYTNPSSTLRLNDRQVGLEDLRIGDEVKVDYDSKDRKNLATSVAAHRK
jgi:hypothetical protein